MATHKTTNSPDATSFAVPTTDTERCIDPLLAENERLVRERELFLAIVTVVIGRGPENTRTNAGRALADHNQGLATALAIAEEQLGWDLPTVTEAERFLAKNRPPKTRTGVGK